MTVTSVTVVTTKFLLVKGDCMVHSDIGMGNYLLVFGIWQVYGLCKSQGRNLQLFSSWMFGKLHCMKRSFGGKED